MPRRLDDSLYFLEAVSLIHAVKYRQAANNYPQYDTKSRLWQGTPQIPAVKTVATNCQRNGEGSEQA